MAMEVNSKISCMNMTKQPAGAPGHFSSLLVNEKIVSTFSFLDADEKTEAQKY
ncbi:uncharacterized protein ASCRUDRAFT_80242 [Ascoidea rubescens DSM 1968]|uniref:Uncharacterized protein n=1 Tax=Ascoidea rubescens DSM 1968 TaxID=1344418 RepID=A0A1D2VJV4_9ASCO|nr:hypothetical protein ASCRUDRAFT_80242 [Ascoidea rubescens DSM 1968]ODV61879.1 hypothetical protein ASCRUDRAFT_80242 [Ascoidea rubescens DSM 1968]